VAPRAGAGRAPLSLRWGLATIAALLLVAAGVFLLFQRQLSGAWFAFGVHPDLVSAVETSLADQKQLAALDPASVAIYRSRFEELERLRNRLRIVEHNRGAIIRRFEALLLGLFGAVLAAAGAAYGLSQARDRRRLARLREALEALSRGRTDLVLAERRRDPIGRVAAMIEDTSRVIGRERRRLTALENLSAWQEAARRHAHEMRTPLTAARLEAERLQSLLAGLPAERREGLEQAAQSLDQELERLGAFTRRFTSFARLPQPRRVRQDLAAVAAEFVATFGEAWPNLRLALEPPPAGESCEAEVDREMLRQVLVNLCENSAQALGERSGRVAFRLGRAAPGLFLEVADDGPGIPAEVRRRLFEPYATTRRIGEGMGLGLAISKKILLDHGGDLELAGSSAAGSTFRLLFPPPEAG
jgi:nitrogen fixation/metabolism regulation signal transduction histidine kinase